MFKVHEDNSKSLVLLNGGQIEYLTSSIAHILMFFINNILLSQGGLTQQAIKLLYDKLSKAEKGQEITLCTMAHLNRHACCWTKTLRKNFVCTKARKKQNVWKYRLSRLDIEN